MVIKGQKSTILEKKSKITKNCQKSWNFSKIWLLSPRIWLVAQTCLPLPNIWPFMKKKFFPYKKWVFLAIFLKKWISDPPNLSKSATTRISIEKCHKEKVIFSPIHGRMQKFRKSYWIVFENMPGAQGPVIYGTTTRTGQGPYPALPDKLCKYSDHLEVISGPWGPLFPLVTNFSAQDVFNEVTSVHLTFYLLSGSALRALSEICFFSSKVLIIFFSKVNLENQHSHRVNAGWNFTF